jgi:uncharacterized protein
VKDNIRWSEVGAVVATGLGKICFMDLLEFRLPFITITILGWVSYIVYRYQKEPGSLKRWGFRTDNFGHAMRLLLPFALFAILAFFGIGFAQDSINVTWHIIPVLMLYPLWGVIQQFLVIGLVAGNLNEMSKPALNTWMIIFITALLFGLIHYPYLWLMGGTFVLALLYGYVYLRVKNIYALGLFHGWLGALFFYTVVERDPFMEVFGRFVNQ